VYTLKLDTPKPIGYNRHSLVMEYLRGKELVYYKDIENPAKLFNKIIKQVIIIYQKLGMVHGDLGEFNIVVDEKSNILIIDWVQWVPDSHPNANQLLQRDIENLCKFFKKKYDVESDVNEILSAFHQKRKKFLNF
ncbi:MAG: RIO1 family regulatory kinase/ATPase domain-containing protein, partial [Promethearchaeota archaeon]